MIIQSYQKRNKVVYEFKNRGSKKQVCRQVASADRHTMQRVVGNICMRRPQFDLDQQHMTFFKWPPARHMSLSSPIVALHLTARSALMLQVH
jgi:hypothetical protein